MRKTWLPWLILSPSLLFLLLFTWFPLGRSVYDSLFDTRMASDGAQYVGLDNFARLFADGVFWQSLVNNLLYILLTVVPGVTLALLLAVALSENHRVNRWLRTAFFFPMIIPMVSAAALWLFIFMPGLGLLDHYLAKLFGPMNNNWLGRSNSALLALALIGVWKFAGYYMLFFLAGLQRNPPLSGEAVRVDEQQLGGTQQQRAAGPGVDQRAEVRRLLHAVFPRRDAEHSGLDAGSGADGRGYPHAGLF